jgi:hypothetical protein
LQYTLSIGGFPGEDEWVKIDGSKGFMKPPGGYGCYAGVGDRGIMGAPIVGLDLMLMDMQAGSARRVVIPPSVRHIDPRCRLTCKLTAPRHLRRPMPPQATYCTTLSTHAPPNSSPSGSEVSAA